MMTPIARFRWAGIAGLLAALLLSGLGWWLPSFLPALLAPDRIGPAAPRIFLLVLGLIATAEMPLMLLVLVQLARRGTSVGILAFTHFGYVLFPAIYALLGTALTGERWWLLAMLFLALVRLVMSLLAVRLPTPDAASGG